MPHLLTTEEFDMPRRFLPYGPVVKEEAASIGPGDSSIPALPGARLRYHDRIGHYVPDTDS